MKMTSILALLLNAVLVIAVPPLDLTTPLLRTSFVFSHNAASGYITIPPTSDSQWFRLAFAKTQEGSFYDQLVDGAKALDLRVKYEDGELIFKHGEYVDIVEVNWEVSGRC